MAYLRPTSGQGLIFDEQDVARASEQSGIGRYLPGFVIIGLSAWDDFLVRDVHQSLFVVPTLPMAERYLRPVAAPVGREQLERDARYAERSNGGSSPSCSAVIRTTRITQRGCPWISTDNWSAGGMTSTSSCRAVDRSPFAQVGSASTARRFQCHHSAMAKRNGTENGGARRNETVWANRSNPTELGRKRCKPASRLMFVLGYWSGSNPVARTRTKPKRLPASVCSGM